MGFTGKTNRGPQFDISKIDFAEMEAKIMTSTANELLSLSIGDGKYINEH